MKRRYNNNLDWQKEREKIIGLGDQSGRKNYYPELKKQLKELQRFKYLLENISEGIILAKLTKFEIFEVNNKVMEMTGFSRKDIIGTNLRKYISGNIENLISRAIEIPKTESSRKTLWLNSYLINKETQKIPVEINLDIREIDEEFFIIALVKDVSYIKAVENRLREEKEFKEIVLNHAGFSIISTDKDGLIKTFNRAAEEMLGYSAEELIGIATPLVFHDKKEITNRALQLSKQFGVPFKSDFKVFTFLAELRQRNEFEWTYISKNGLRFPVILNISAIYNENNEISGYIGIAKDITLSKLHETELNEIADKISSKTGKEFFNEVIEFLAGSIDADVAAVVKYHSESNTAETISYSNAKRLIRNFTYKVNNVPCEKVIQTGKEYFTDKLKEEYPENRKIFENGYNSYYGIPINDKEGKLTGIAFVIKKGNIHNIEKIKSVVKIFAARLTSELQRLEAEENLVNAKKISERESKIKSELFSVISYKLKKSIESISTITDLIRKDSNLETGAGNSGDNFLQLETTSDKLKNTIGLIEKIIQINRESSKKIKQNLDLDKDVLSKIISQNVISDIGGNRNIDVLYSEDDHKITAVPDMIILALQIIIETLTVYTKKYDLKITLSAGIRSIFIIVPDLSSGIAKDLQVKLIKFSGSEFDRNYVYDDEVILNMFIAQKILSLQDAELSVNLRNSECCELNVIFN